MLVPGSSLSKETNTHFVSVAVWTLTHRPPVRASTLMPVQLIPETSFGLVAVGCLGNIFYKNKNKILTTCSQILLVLRQSSHMVDLPEPQQEKAAGNLNRDFVLAVISRRLELDG